MPQGKIKIPLSYRVYFIVLTSVATCALLIGTFNYYENKEMLSENLGSGLKKIAQTAVLSIDGDSLGNIQSAEDLFYIQIRGYLLDLKRSNDIESPLYILKSGDKNTAQLLVTTEPGSLVGARYRLNPTMEYVLNSGKSDFSPIYTDKNGTWISAYAPIKNRNEQLIGVLELNHHVGYYINQLRYRLLNIIALCLFGFLTGTLLGLPLLRPILNSIGTLNIAASEIEKGNYDYEIKLKTSDEIGHLAYALEKMRIAIKNYIEKLKESWLNEKKAHLESIKALSEAIAIREPYTKGHIERVSRYAELIARELRLPEEEIETLKYGCILHDVGKIGISVELINKPSQLTPSEYEQIKKHPHLGAQVIEGIKFLERARDVILYHQERYDGKGYPHGLKGEEIPILARIVAVTDAYDAMATDRPYRERLDKKEIVSNIKKESGKQFDPKVVDAFLKVVDKLLD